MDKNIVVYVCQKCLYEKKVLFYAMCGDDYNTGFDMMDENLSRQRDAENSICPNCGHKGFVNKLSLKRKNNDEK
jgi:DNA-directed RNA polymerase subunit M/transcription elongation factor TFIIS